MGLSILNNIPSLEAQNQLAMTNTQLQNTLFQLSSGSKINSGADDPAGLSIADGLQANISALTQSAQNVTDGVGMLQTADGALSQVTTLLNRAVTLATEAANGGLSTSQLSALDNEYQSIQAEITRIGGQTTFNGSSVFTASTTSIFLGSATNSIGVTIGTLSATTLALNTTSLTASTAATALDAINAAVESVASSRGTLGATLNRLTAAQNVISNQVTNITSAENLIRAANIPEDVAEESQLSVLEQTGISALTQANTQSQQILRLFQ